MAKLLFVTWETGLCGSWRGGTVKLTRPLSSNLLAFAIHTVCDCLEDLWIKARETKCARKRFFEHIRAIAAYLVFPSWETLMTSLINSKPRPKSKIRWPAEIAVGGEFRIAGHKVKQFDCLG